MIVKNNKEYDIITEGLYAISNNINKSVNEVKLESNNNIRVEMLYDLKNHIIESFNIIKDKLNNRYSDFIYENITHVLTTFSNIKKHNSSLDSMENELEKLNEVILLCIKDIEMPKYNSLYIDIINKSSSDIIKQINIVNNKLYDQETLCLEGYIPESFNDIYTNTLEGLTESIIQKVLGVLDKIKIGFSDKHEKIIKRDKDWLASNKKAILSKNYNNIQLEILTDNSITFENLMNRHNTFDKIFVNSTNLDILDSKLARFEDKKGDLKNGLDNYFRTGTSKREIGTRKVAGQEAKKAVENMIAYCESFLAGRKYLDDKINIIASDLGKNEKVEESVNYSHIFNGTSPFNISRLLESIEELDDDSNSDDEDDNSGKNKIDESKEKNRSIRDRQLGIAVLLTVAEDRYFDYIKVLHGLAE